MARVRIPVASLALLAVASMAAPVAMGAPPAAAPVVEAPGAFIGDQLPPVSADRAVAAQRLAWSAVPFAACGSYEVEITDRTAGTTAIQPILAAPPPLPAIGTAAKPPTALLFGSRYVNPQLDPIETVSLVDGHLYAFRVRAVERAPSSQYPGSCVYGDVGAPEPGPWSPQTADTRYDSGLPVMTAALAGGRAFTRTHRVTLDVTAVSDPSPAGLPGTASGVTGVLVNDRPVPSTPGPAR